MPLLLIQRSENVRQNAVFRYQVQRCNPTAAQKPATAEGNTISVGRHIHGVSELTIRHRGYAELGVRTHIPRLHRTNHHQPPPEKLTLSLLQQCSSGRCCAGSSSVRFGSNYAYSHRLPTYVPDHHHAVSLLFGQRCRNCFWYVVTDLIINFVCNI